MVKKKTKEQEHPAKDEFDPLEMISKKAQTVILMLKSEEHGVLQTACDALFKFSGKCEENIQQLVDFGVFECLMPLVSHPEKTVRRNAIMCLGIISTEVSVQKQLRDDNHIRCLISLLAPEEESIFHEHSSLTLGHLASSYCAKSSIFENGGIECFLHLLSSNDCDVQKNSVETLVLLLEDYRCCISFLGLNGIEPLTHLLDSEYPIIQQLALKALWLCSNHACSLVTLREVGCVNKLVQLIGTKEMDDLHIPALKVLCNCLRDPDSLQDIKELGLIDSLLSFIVESSISDVQVYAIQVIEGVAHDEHNRKILNEHRIEETLVSMLTNENTALLPPIANALATMSKNARSCDSIGKLDVLSHFLGMLRGDCVEAKEASMNVLNQLTASNASVRSELVERHGLELIIKVICECHHSPVLIYATSCLSNLSRDDSWRIEMGKLDVISTLVSACARSIDPDVHCSICHCLAIFLADNWARKDFCSAEGCELMSKLLLTSYDSVRRSACWVVTMACYDASIADHLTGFGIVEELLEMNQSDTRKSIYTQNALNMILNCNLSAKYSITNELEATDVIPDNFYDVGRLRDGQALPGLNVLLTDPIDDKRAIIFVSTQKIRKRVEPCTMKDQSDSMVDIPRDMNFITYVERVNQLLKTHSEQKDQAIELAQFVSEVMGGKIERNQLSDYHYELELSQLKSSINSNVIPIGMIEKGFYYHRALLFKALADRIRLSCTLTRGSYGRAWNEVSFIENDKNGKVSLPPCRFLIDLMHSPGEMIPINDPKAIRYQRF